jgi:hypothetical protein
MASTPTVLYLKLDAGYDPLFDPTSSLANTAAVTQIILTRLKLFLGEWWENVLIGLPVFQQILGQLGSAQGLAAMTLAVQQNIEGGPYVTSATVTAVTFADGVLSITATAQTAFGTINISTAPAITSAGLGY